MQCPVCKDVALVMSDRQGVEIDYCPRCRGVWLDRGELDKIIQRSDSLDDDDDDDRKRGYKQQQTPQGDYHHQKQYKRKSFWHELFD